VTVYVRTSGVVLRAVINHFSNQLELRHLNVGVDVDWVLQLPEEHRVHGVAD